VPVEEGLVAVVVAKTALVASLAAFVAGALVLAWAIADMPPAMLAVLALLAAYMGASTIGFLWAQLRGIFRMGGRALAWIGLGERVSAVAGRLDVELRWFYRARRGRAAAAFGLSLVGWATGALETWLMLFLLGSPVTLLTALVIEAGAAGVRAVGFLVPGSLGVLEGGIVGLFALRRLDPATGLAFGFVRRIREAVWILAGYACLVVLRGARVTAPAPDP
jgi:uncharacterized membrane protein YbhN (UPF0104 family)